MQLPEGVKAYACPPPGKGSHSPLTLEDDALAVMRGKVAVLETEVASLRKELATKDATIQRIIDHNSELQQTMASMFEAVVKKLPEFQGAQKAKSGG